MNGSLRWRNRWLLIGAAGVAASLAAVATDPVQFERSYLFAWIFWLGCGLGSLAILMIHHLAGGRWAVPLRPGLEAASATLGWLAILFIPILAGGKALYPWFPGNAPGIGKEAYLNLPFFVARSVFYLALWIVLARKIVARSAEPSWDARARVNSGWGITALGFSASFAAIDWIMSLEPRWYSTAYGMAVVTGMGLLAMTFSVLVWSIENRSGRRRTEIPDKVRWDLGNVLLTFVIVWGYVSFFQFLVIWMGNLPDEVAWYTRRSHGGWGAIIAIVALFQLAGPFVLLLFREIKARRARLGTLACVIFAVHVLEIHWLIMPAFSPGRLSVHWQDLAAFVAVGGLWIAAYLSARARLPRSFTEVVA